MSTQKTDEEKEEKIENAHIVVGFDYLNSAKNLVEDSIITSDEFIRCASIYPPSQETSCVSWRMNACF